MSHAIAWNPRKRIVIEANWCELTWFDPSISFLAPLLSPSLSLSRCANMQLHSEHLTSAMPSLYTSMFCCQSSNISYTLNSKLKLESCAEAANTQKQRKTVETSKLNGFCEISINSIYCLLAMRKKKCANMECIVPAWQKITHFRSIFPQHRNRRNTDEPKKKRSLIEIPSTAIV